MFSFHFPLEVGFAFVDGVLSTLVKNRPFRGLQPLPVLGFVQRLRQAPLVSGKNGMLEIFHY